MKMPFHAQLPAAVRPAGGAVLCGGAGGIGGRAHLSVPTGTVTLAIAIGVAALLAVWLAWRATVASQRSRRPLHPLPIPEATLASSPVAPGRFGPAAVDAELLPAQQSCDDGRTLVGAR